MLAKVALIALLAAVPALAAEYIIKVEDGRKFEWNAVNKDAVVTSGTQRGYSQQGRDHRPEYRNFKLSGPAGEFNCRLEGNFKNNVSPTFIFGAGKLCQEHDGVKVTCTEVDCKY